jgi:RsmE family RNA methyltransferase
MNLLLLCDADLADEGGLVRVSGRRAAHLLDVLGVGVGSSVKAGWIGGRMGHAMVVAVEGREVVLQPSFDCEPPPRLDLRLVIALPRPKVLRRILQTSAAMGLRAVHLVNSWRVDKSYWGSPLLERSRLTAELLLGAEQGRDTVLPRVEVHRLFKPFVEDELGVLAADTMKLVGDIAAGEPCPSAVTRPVTLVVGPEGGLIPYEVDALKAIGFRAVHLGPRPLRVEQAVPAFVGRLAPRSIVDIACDARYLARNAEEKGTGEGR